MDSLGAELARHSRVKARPNSTGDAEPPAFKLRLPSRFTNNYSVDSATATTVARPHAPLSFVGGGQRRGAHQAEQQQSLEKELSQGLARMLGSLSVKDAGAGAAAGGGRLSSPRVANVQFLNIEEKDSYDFGTLTGGPKTKSSKTQVNVNVGPTAFSIPESPKGRELVFNILSTWGDRHYLGLNGIEIYDNRGNLCQVASISADPADVNVLPENTNDPRTVDKLVDGVNHT